MAIETGKIGVHIEADYSKFINDVAKAGDLFETSMRKMQHEAGETQKRLEAFAKRYGISVQEVKQVIDRIKKDQDDEYKRNVERERIAQNNRRLELQYYNDRISAVRNLGMAMAGLVASQMTINKFFDWSKNLTSLDQFSKIVGTATDKVIAFRNAAHENNVDYNSSYNALSRANDYNYNLRYNIGAMSKEDRILAAYNSDLTRSTDKNGREYDSTDRLIQQSRALQTFGKMNPQDNMMKRHLALYYAHGDAALAEMLLSGNMEKEIREHMGQGKSIANGIENARKAMQNKAKIENEKGVIESDAFNNISPLAIKFMEEFNKFLANHEAMSAYIVNFAQLVLLIGTLTSLSKGINNIGGGLFGGGLAGVLAGKQNGGGALKNIKGGLLLPLISRLSLILALTSPLSGDTFETPEQKSKRLKSINDLTKNHDQMLANNKDRISDIEKNLGVKVDYSYYNGKFFIADKKGNFLLYVDDLNESLPQLKDKIETVKKPSKWNPFNWIFPSAHGEERHTDPYYRREDALTHQSAVNPTEAFRTAADFFISKGFSRAQVAGLLSRMEKESGGRYNAQNPYGSAYGLFQWTTARQKDFKQIFGYDIHNSSTKDQLNFLWWELNHTESAGYKRLKTAMSPYDAGYAVSKNIIRPGANIAEQINEAIKTGDRARSWYDKIPLMLNRGSSANTTNNTANNNYTINVHVTGKTDGKTLAEEIRRHLPGPSTHATQTANGLS